MNFLVALFQYHIDLSTYPQILSSNLKILYFYLALLMNFFDPMIVNLTSCFIVIFSIISLISSIYLVVEGDPIHTILNLFIFLDFF